MKIETKKELCRVLNIEKKIYFPNSTKAKIFETFVNYRYNIIFKYIKLLRYAEFYKNNKNKSIYYQIKYLMTERKKNKLGYKLGFEICENVCEEGLLIEHAGTIVINGEAKIGKNCKLHGQNCIGNNGKTSDAPRIGNNVDIGVGACIIGNVKIADDIVIGAGSVVVDSFFEKGIVIAGVPARKIR